MKNKVIISALSIFLTGQTLISSIPLTANAKTTHEISSKKRAATKNASVSTMAELEAALKDATVTDIDLNADVELTKSLTAVGAIKNLHAHDHTINSADAFYIKLEDEGATALLEDAKIINGDEFGIFYSTKEGVKVTYRNVDHTGKRLLRLLSGDLTLEGKVTSNITKYEGFFGNSLTIRPNAEVNLSSTTTVAEGGSDYVAPIRLTSSGPLQVGANAILNVHSSLMCILADSNSEIINEGTMDLKSSDNDGVYLASGNTIRNKAGGTLKVESESTGNHSAINMPQGKALEIESGSTFEAKSNGTKATIYMGNSSLNFADQSNFAVENHNQSGHLFHSVNASTISLAATKKLKTWNIGSSLSGEPSHVYEGPLTATFSLSGSTQSALNSNNQDLQSTFQVNDLQKIAAGDTSRVSTHATIDIIQPENPTDPHPPIVGPTDPDDGTNQVGNLTLDYASSFDFGSLELNSQGMEGNLVGPKTSNGEMKAVGLQVTDVRGTGAGWKVSAALSSFEGQSHHHPLKGARLTLPAGELVTQNDSNIVNAPTAKAVNLDADNAEQIIFQADVDQGLGTWFDHMDPKKVKLSVPSSNTYADAYQATLTWNLSDTPPA